MDRGTVFGQNGENKPKVVHSSNLHILLFVVSDSNIDTVTFELFRDRHGFVIGGMPGTKYREYEIQLQPGDKLFLYTDGVPEATNAREELFGTARMLDALNETPEETPKNILSQVRRSVDAFVGDAEQFDDLTMLCMEYKGTGEAPAEEQSV